MNNRQTYSVYVHKVNTEDGPKYYTGVTANVEKRWSPSQYHHSSLLPYIEQYGWANIEHAVVFESEDYIKSREIEGQLILFYSSIGRQINRNRSGLITENQKAYFRDKYKTDQKYAEHKRQYHRQYHRDKSINDIGYVEKRRERGRCKNATPEGKIYNRVFKFNHTHPDRVTETALEAKRKYMEYGYIPTYVKHDDIPKALKCV